MISFESDYITGAHPKVLQRLIDTNLEVQSGYGLDEYCASAAEKIKAACGCPDAQVQFLAGGTQTNAIVISTMLQEFEGVISAETGHIQAHEAGALEYAGHKILTLPQQQGKLKAEDVRTLLKTFYADESHEHMVYPGMVYISHPTEYGALYSKQELKELADVCYDYSIPLFMDGARLAYGLMSHNTDVTLQDITELCDVFYIGGTKAGALCGEAVVFTHKNIPAHWMNRIKKRGALLAKGRLLGAQFDALFTDGLYFEIGKHAVDLAEKLKSILLQKGYKLYMDSYTNQQFPILDKATLERLRREVAVTLWEWLDKDHAVVRMATTWSTTQEDLDKLEALL
ncbi:MAG: aminotransferase class I/II-fold pyridoxal phosphate-dependent enzyme [Ruminococcaceae bacterium]|nr:aminotransferase class I/II-fold pyridoxal phosphate-dependent enzyme [Oscillospiraceae bacterium]